jgi:hypothetical protein
MATYVAVIGVVKLDDGRVLLLKRNAKRRTSPNKWQTPSGFMNEGESAEVLISVKSDKVVIDTKEHSEFRWIKVDEVSSFECVKGIDEDLKAVGLKN